MLIYSPDARMMPLKLLKLPFFDELRVEGKTLPDGSPLPQLFNFNKEELNPLPDEDFNTSSLIPDWYRI